MCRISVIAVARLAANAGIHLDGRWHLFDTGRTMKVYHVPDLDGLIEAMVAASSVAEAASALGVSARTMRERGWASAKGATAIAARSDPGRPVYRSIVGSRGPWTPDRAAALARAARAALRGRAR